MKNQTPTFLPFEEAVEAIQRDPDAKFIGLLLDDDHVSAFVIEVDPSEPDTVSVTYSGGELFEDCCEEDFFDGTSAPTSSRRAFYALAAELGDGEPEIMGMTTEYVLSQILPDVGDPEEYETEEAFKRAARECFESFWQQV